MQVKVRKTGFNEFLMSPIVAHIGNEAVYVNHAFKTMNGVIFSYEDKNGKSGNASVKDIEFYGIDLGKVERLIQMAR